MNKNLLNFNVKKRAHRAYAPRLLVFLLILLCTGLALFGCIRREGSYPLDFFQEMHYQPSIKSQEPPRLYPPANSVPVTGKEITYTHEESKLQKNPLNLKSEADRQMGERLFNINCSLCHGELGKGGNTTIIGTLLSSGGSVPADLTSTNTKSRSDGDIFYIVTNGAEALGTQGMPNFKNLLTPNERWSIILHIRELQKNQ